MKKPSAAFTIVKGIYDIFASYLLAWVLFFAFLALGFHLAFELILGMFDIASAEIFWRSVQDRLGISSLWLRLPLFLTLHAVAFWLLRPVLGKLQGGVEQFFDGIFGRFGQATQKLPRVKMVLGLCLSLLVTVLLIPFVLQPTLVPPADMSPSGWATRSANLLDGQATMGFARSMVKMADEPSTAFAYKKQETKKASCPNKTNRSNRGKSSPGIKLFGLENGQGARGKKSARGNKSARGKKPAKAKEFEATKSVGRCGETSSWPSRSKGFEERVVELTNRERATGAICGGRPYRPAGPVEMNEALREAARCHSVDMQKKEYFSHKSKDGRSFSDRARDANYQGFPRAENIAVGQQSPESVVRSWMKSPGHCKNIMLSDAKHIGIGFHVEGRYWTMVLGK